MLFPSWLEYKTQEEVEKLPLLFCTVEIFCRKSPIGKGKGGIKSILNAQ